MNKYFSWTSIFFRQNYLLFILVFTLFIKGLLFNFFTDTSLIFPNFLWTAVISLFLIFVLIIPFAIFRKHRFGIYFSINIIFTLLLFVDTIYFSFFKTIPSVTLLGSSGQVDDVMPAVKELINPLYFLFFVDIILAFFLRIKFKEQIKVFDRTLFTIKNNYLYTGIVFLTSFLMTSSLFYIDKDRFFKAAFGVTFDNKITVENYGVYAAHIFDVYLDIERSNKKLSTIEREEVISWINNNKVVQKDNQYTGTASGKNIILIQVESLQSFLLGATLDGQEITPNLNKFIKETQSFENNYFQIGAGSTSDSDFTINTSLYPEKSISVFMKKGDDDFTSLGKALKEYSYSSYAYHSYIASFWNREIAFKSLGFDKFYAADSYPKGEKVGPGLNDKDFLLKTADYIESQPKPSFSYVVTLSSHYPFEMDKENEYLKIPEGRYPEIVSEYIQSIRYTDEALGEFFDSLKEKGLYEDSLIVLYGDHYANIDSFSLDNEYIDVESLKGKQVPLLFKFPNQKEIVIHKEVSGHIDVMPTILNLVGAKTDFPMFGRDLFSDANPKYYSAKFVDVGTVLTDELRISLVNNHIYTCQKLQNGEYIEADMKGCDEELEKKKKTQEFVSKLIYFNLFEYL